MFTQYLSALMFIFFAEMGDKTQILAMMFATRYKVRTVLSGVLIGSFLNHGIAVLIGALLGKVIDVYVLQFIAGIAFIGFSLWTLKEEEEEEEEEVKTTKNGILTVALAFFLGELGDKTQLTAITLAVDSMYPFIVLLGTVSGMVLTSSLGIFVGAKIGDQIPETLIKILSASIFLLFGAIKIITSAPVWLQNSVGLGIFILIIIYVMYRIGRLVKSGAKSGQLSSFKRAAHNLYTYTHEAKYLMDELCLTPAVCGSCKGEKCGIGLIKHILADLEDCEKNHKKTSIGSNDHDHEELIRKLIHKEKAFDLQKLEELKRITSYYLQKNSIAEPMQTEIIRIERVVLQLIEENKRMK